MPKLPFSEEQRERVRKQIIAAAHELFETGGIDGVSMRAIGARVGLTAAALYAYFPAKADLVRAMWWEALEEFDRGAQALSQREADPMEAIKALGLAYARFALENPARFRMLFLSDGDRPVPELIADRSREGTYDLLLRRVTEAMAQGQMRRPSNPELIAQTLWAGVHGVFSLTNSWSDFPFQPPPLLVSTMMETLMAGFQAAEPKE